MRGCQSTDISSGVRLTFHCLCPGAAGHFVLRFRQPGLNGFQRGNSMTRPITSAGLALLFLFAVAACRNTGADPAPEDTTAPTVHISSPAAFTPLFVGEAFTLQGQSSDDTRVTRVAVRAGDADPFDATLQADGSWSAPVTPTVAGTLSITATAFDAASNHSEASQIDYSVHHRGRSLLIDTFTFTAGIARAGLRIYAAENGLVDRTAALTTATVTVNDESIPLDGSTFQGPLSAPLPAGQPVALSVSEGGLTVNVEWNMPAIPVQTGPADGDTIGAGDEVVLTWDSSDDPDYFQILLLPDVGSSSWSRMIPGDERSFEVDLSALPGGASQIAWEVVASNAASPADFAGPAAAGSRAVGEARSGLWKWAIGSP